MRHVYADDRNLGSNKISEVVLLGSIGEYTCKYAFLSVFQLDIVPSPVDLVTESVVDYPFCLYQPNVTFSLADVTPVDFNRRWRNRMG